MEIFSSVSAEALWLVFNLVLLPLLASFVVGAFVGLLQTLTQVQDQFLSFFPKLLVTILVLTVYAGFMLNALLVFTGKMFDLMLQVGK
jgi:flagellar biosynthetic protein FliQ